MQLGAGIETFCAKCHTKIFDKINQDFELCQVFIYNFMGQNVQIFALYILLIRRINTFWSKSTEKFCSEAIRKFWVQNLGQEKSTKFVKIFKSISNLVIIFYPKMS